MRLVDQDKGRDDFMQLVYDELSSDPTNDRANRIIEAYDDLPTVEAASIDKVKAWGIDLIESNSDAHITFCAECGFPIADYGDKEIYCSWCKAKNLGQNYVASGSGYCTTSLDRNAKTLDKLLLRGRAAKMDL